MAACYYCNRGAENHEFYCPVTTGDKTAFQCGVEDGGFDREMSSNDPTYELGYCKGKKLAEEIAQEGDAIWL